MTIAVVKRSVKSLAELTLAEQVYMVQRRQPFQQHVVKEHFSVSLLVDVDYMPLA
jgi:hypothetical protein